MNAENPTDIRRTPTQPHTDSDPVVQRGPVELLLGHPRLPVLAHRRRRVSTQVNFIDAERISISDLTPGHTSAYIISKKKISLDTYSECNLIYGIICPFPSFWIRP